MSVRRRVADAVNIPLDVSAAIVRGAFYSTANVVRTTSMRFYRSASGWGYAFMNRTRYNYQAEVGNPANNSIVIAAVGWISRNFPEAPLRIAVLPTSDEAPMEFIRPAMAGPGNMLWLIEHPNPYYSGPLQWMATILDRYTTGNAYWIKVRAPGSGRVTELWWVPSWCMEPIWDEADPTSFIEWYVYTVDGVSYGYRPTDIVHFRDGIDPYNTRKGLSPLQSLFREIFTDDEASNMTASLMRNLGVPGVVMSPANTTGPTGRFQDPEAMKATFMEKFGGDKRGEPMINTVPTDIKVLSWSPQQMSMRELRKIPEERVTAVIGVPAIVAGLGAGLDRSTFSNFSEARKAAFEEAIIPAQRIMAADLNIQLLPDFGGTVKMSSFFDWTKASPMQEAAADIWKRHQEAATKGLLTRADFKRAVGVPVNDAEDNIYVVANNMLFMPRDAELLPPPPPAPRPAPDQIGPGEQPKQIGPGNPPAQEQAALNGHTTEVLAA